MHSFRKKSDCQINIPGTKLKNNLLHVSTGIPSLDHIVGTGLPCGSVFVLEEDILNIYSNILTKYFIAEGIECEHELLITSLENNPKDIVQHLPAACKVLPDEDVNSIAQTIDKMKIAWRYEGLSQVESSFGNTTNNFGHHFDLSRNIDDATIEKANITFYDPSTEITEKSVKGFKNDLYYKLLSKIEEIVALGEYRNMNKSNGKILRITIQSLGSSLWMGKEFDDDSNFAQDLIKFMYCLRIILRDANAVAFVTIPSHLFDDDHVMKRVLHSADNAVRLESFAGSKHETNPVYKDYHGLLHITKLSSMHSIVPFVPPSLDLAFKLKRKRFIIEKLHLPPELQDTSEREQDDITATPTCGGFKKKDIEF